MARGTISRRRLLGWAASLLHPPGARGPVTQPIEDEALQALEVAFRQALITVQAQQQRFNRCERLYLSCRPQLPPVLTRAGPLRALLPDRFASWTAKELRSLAQPDSREAVEQEARRLLHVAEAHELALERCAAEIGLSVAEEDYAAALGVVDRLCTQILHTEARSLVGFAVKARVVRDWGEPHWWKARGEADCSQQLAAQVLDAVIAIAEIIAERHRARSVIGPS